MWITVGDHEKVKMSVHSNIIKHHFIRTLKFSKFISTINSLGLHWQMKESLWSFRKLDLQHTSADLTDIAENLQIVYLIYYTIISEWTF